jgi:excisionase family DNA binding protein
MDSQFLMTTEEVAELLRMKTDSVVNWRYRDSGPPYIKIGGRVRYRRADVERWLDNHPQRNVNVGEGDRQG